MRLEFDSIEELKTFVKNELKGTRRGKGEEEPGDPPQAPAPIMPPTSVPSQFHPSGFAEAPKSGFPGVASAISPEVTALVQRINAKIDGALTSGQPADTVLNWFRQRCGPDASAATLDQIKTAFLPKLSIPHLEDTAKLMGA